MTPGQLLERVGFTSAQLSTPVKDLSGGQKRRLQLLLIILDEPNVLILDEPTNDLDTDMLAAMEDLLDSWSGTLIVVSHDRYFLERVTDQQFAILDAKLRHLPGGVDEYLRLRALQDAEPSRSAASGTVATAPGLQGAELRAAQKEASATERRIEKLQQQIDRAKAALAEHDQADYVGLGAEMQRISTLEAERDELEMQWFELTEAIG
jgi:ABC-type multidrug transport system ATPase subunit